MHLWRMAKIMLFILLLFGWLILGTIVIAGPW
jgi:hypothetical protein